MPRHETVIENGQEYIVTTFTKDDISKIPELRDHCRNFEKHEKYVAYLAPVPEPEWQPFRVQPTDNWAIEIVDKSIKSHLPGQPRKLPEKTRHDRINFSPSKAARKKQN